MNRSYLLAVIRSILPHRPHARIEVAPEMGRVRILFFGPVAEIDMVRMHREIYRSAPVNIDFDFVEHPAPTVDVDALAHRVLMDHILGRREDAIAAATVLHDALLESGILLPESTLIDAVTWAEDAYPAAVAESLAEKYRKILDPTGK